MRHTEADRAAIEDDTRCALTTLAGLGVHPRRWRTPWGAQAPWTAGDRRRRTTCELCGWDVDTHDWRGDAAEAMLAAVGPELHAGASCSCTTGWAPARCARAARRRVRFTRMIAAESVAV